MNIFLALIISFVSIISIFAQEDGKTSSAVELPDFVITGKDVVKIKKSDKLNPFLITTFTEKFVLPTYSPEEIPVKEILLPIRDDLNFLNTSNFFKGYVSAAFGFYSLPELDVLYATPIENGIFKSKFNGLYNRPHFANSDNYSLEVNANLLKWTDINSSFLPGTQFQANVDLFTKGFKFYGADNPTEKRTVNSFTGNIDILNEYNSSFLFKIKAKDKYTSLSNENFKENFIDLGLNSLLRISVVNIGVLASYKNAYLSNDTSNHQERNYFLIRPTAGFQFTNLVKGSFGFTFSKTELERFISPYAELAFKVGKSITLLAEFNPSTELLTPSNFISKNPYFISSKSTNLLIKNKMQYLVSAKYEYEKYFDIIGGFKYFSSDSIPYFSEHTKGKYSLKFSDVKSMTPFINLNFFPGPYGFFFASLELNAAANDSGSTLPYVPSFKLNANYGYTFNETLTSSLNFTFAGRTFTDLSNSNKINNYINLALSLSYNFDNRFDFFVKFENLINKQNYIWNNYREEPFDLILGVKYKL